MTIFDKLLGLIREGVAVQSLLALLVIVALVYQVVVLKAPADEMLSKFAILILGFYFGSKSSIDAQTMVKALLVEEETPLNPPSRGEEG